MTTAAACRWGTRRPTCTSTFHLLPLLVVFGLVSAGRSAPPDLGWSYPSATPLQVHVVRGYSYYTRDYRVEEVLAHSGANLLTESTQSDRGVSQYGGSSSAEAGWLRGNPDPAGLAMDHHLIVVCSVGASQFGKNQQVLVDFVKRGGSVLFFCDSSAFGDRTGKSPLAEIVPLEFAAEGPWRLETEQVAEGVELKAGPDGPADGLPGIDAANPPRAYSYYKVQPKPDAKVLLVAGEDKPILIAGEFGKGRVAVFTATCRGYPKEGQLAYWRWDGWPTLLAGTLKEISQSARTAPHGLAEKAQQEVVAARGRAFDLLDGPNEAGRAEFEALLHSTAVRCHDRSTAEFLIGTIAAYPLDIPAELSTALGQIVLPWVDEDFTEPARALLDSGQSGKTILGLTLLGATRAGDARATLEEFYASGTTRSEDSSDDSLDGVAPESVTAFMQADENAAQIRRAAVTGFGNLGDAAALPILSRAVATHAAGGRYQPEATATAIESEHRDYQNALVASLLCGDEQAAGPVIDSLLGNLSVISQEGTEPDERRAAVVWQQQLYRRLTAAPDGVLPALAKRIASGSTSSVIPAALAVFGGKELSPEVTSLLGESSVAAVAALGK